MMLYIKLIIKLDKLTQANSDCQGHIPSKSCIGGMKPVVGGVNKTQFSCYLYTQGYHKLHRQPRKMPLFLF